MNESLEALLAGARVWRARSKDDHRVGVPPRLARVGAATADSTRLDAGRSESESAVVPTGWPALDAALPDGGWPLGTLVELLLPAHGVGELQLLLPALRALCGSPGAGSTTHAPAGRGSNGPPGPWLVWIAPPHAPYPPALAQAGLEPSRVLLVDAGGTQDRLWAVEQALHSRSCGAVLAWLDDADDRWLRRLKLAAEPGRTLAVLFRPVARRAQASPAALRLVLEPHGDRLDVEMVKSRGGPRRVTNALGLR